MAGDSPIVVEFDDVKMLAQVVIRLPSTDHAFIVRLRGPDPCQISAGVF